MLNIRFITILLITIVQSYICSYSQTNVTTSKPLPGEGINALLIRNGLDPQKNYDLFIEINPGKFGKNNALLSHNSYTLPTIKREAIFEPLFGEKNKEIKLTSNELSGSIIYLISGHGGPDPGASGIYDTHVLNEDEYAYDITLRLAKKLREMGSKVYIIVQDPDDGIREDQFLTYDNDETCMGETIPLDQVERLRQRVKVVNQLSTENKGAKYQRSISIHLDSRSNTKQIDVFFYYHEGSKKGKEMAETLQTTFDEKYKKYQPQRGFTGTVKDRALYEVKYTNPVSVFIELGNICNFRDQQRFIFADNRQALANWISEGIAKDYKNTTKKPTNK